MTSQVTSPEVGWTGSAHFFPRFFNFSGILGNVRDCSRCLWCYGTRAKPLYKGWISAHARAKARHFFSALFGFSVFFVVFYGCSRCLWCFGGGGEALV